MNARLAAVVVLVGTGVALAEPVEPPLGGAVMRETPLLFVRLQGPAGMSVRFLEGPTAGRSFDAPVVAGLRPAMRHRAQLTGLPNRPGASLYPTLEVRGTLQLPVRLRAADYPAPVPFTEADIEQALAGIMVTKIITVEAPEKSGGLAQEAGQIVEWNVEPERDAIEVARGLGRPVLIVRIGQREPDAQELARMRPGSILYPGETALPPAPPVAKGGYGPTYPGYPYPLPPSIAFGPRVSDSDRPLRKEGGEECLTDGGDRGKPVHLDSLGQLQGLDPSDTVAEFKDSAGRRKLVVSNEVCLCVPRFLLVRQLVPLSVHDGVTGTFRMDGRDRFVQLDRQEGTRRTRQVDETPTMRSRQRLNANIVVTPQIRLQDIQELNAIDMVLGKAVYIGTDQLRMLTEEERTRLKRQMELAIRLNQQIGTGGVMAPSGTKAIGRIDGLGQVTSQVELREVSCLCMQEPPQLPEQPLHICKWASTDSAQIGDVVTFFIRYSNLGGKPIKDIAISDSLTGRLEYVPGTAKSDREAVFVTQDNDAGSVILRWEVRDPLPGGQRGVVSFQARVR
jgi:uncharacterized repeat protein (TIGR01451 family)